jgi:hypothetical protein
MKISDLIGQFSGRMRQTEALFALIEIAANLKSGRLQDAELHFSDRARNPETLHLLEGAARVLNDADRDTRYFAISAFLDSVTDQMIGNFWIRKEACDQILNLVGEAPTVRFSFANSLRPCLTYAYRCDVAGKRTEVSFCDINEEWGRVLRNLLEVLEIGAPVLIETEWPWQRGERVQSEIEVVFPPFGAHVSDTNDIPHATLNGLGMRETKNARLSMESLAIADALEHTSGKVIMSLSDGALFRMVGTEPVARRNLLDSGRLQAVMNIPSGLMFTQTAIKTNILVMSDDKTQSSHVRFTDMGHESLAHRGHRNRFDVEEDVDWANVLNSDAPEDRTLLRDIEHNEIHENNVVLLPDRYLNVGAKERLDLFLANSDVAMLDELVEMIRPASLSQDDEGEYTLFEASPSDLDERGFIGHPGRVITVDRAKYNKASNQQLRPGDVLLSIKGNVGVVAMVPADVPKEGENEIWTAGQSMMILRPKKRISISSLALYEYLSNATVHEFLKSLAGGGVIPNLAMKDLKGFPVVLPDEETIDRVKASFAERQGILDQISALQKQLADVRDQGWPHLQLRDDG